MALQYSPKIVTDNLVMCLDASQNKSFPSTTLPVKQNLTLWLDASDSTTFIPEMQHYLLDHRHKVYHVDQ